ncbi:aquaporin [Capsulimonas corticalis]|uniref:Aquaporin n=1 Tax=Capsulimonas corticalis TaxID=2219043 RepID=A0A402CU20_9BACT|nr:MIP family channel protein [Capsulimonas corticalis]BDI28843.1 aquaporin [Capsulimonas corticalis]
MRRNTLTGELVAEFLGALVLIALGEGVVASVAAGGNSDFLMITFAWGFAVTMGVYVAGGLSGAHLNPAVTIALAARGDLPWRKVAPYIGAQVAGAFCGAGIALLDYYKLIDKHASDLVAAGKFPDFQSAKNSLDGIFFTHPKIDLVSGFIDQLIGTALLLLLIRAVTDTRNSSPLSNLGPVVVGLIVVVIGMSFGTMAGYAINPARDFGPRLLTAAFGWGSVPFTEDGGYWWVPIVAPIIGGLIGIYAYDFGIRRFLIEKGEQRVPGEVVEAETVRQKLAS